MCFSCDYSDGRSNLNRVKFYLLMVQVGTVVFHGSGFQMWGLKDGFMAICLDNLSTPA